MASSAGKASQTPEPGASQAVPMPDAAVDMAGWRTRIDAAEDFESLMQSALAIADPSFRNTVVSAIIDRWLVVDIPGFIRYLNALEVAGAKDSLAIVALALQDSLARVNDETAASDEILVVVQRLVSYLAATDPWKALAWARKFLLDYTLDSSLVAIARGMARTDVEAALQLAEGIASLLRRSQAFAAIAAVWAAKDPAAAVSWASSLTNPAERALSLNSILLVAADQDLPGAARLLSEQAQLINADYLRERRATLAALGLTEADLVNDPESYRALFESGAIPPPSSPDVELLAAAGKVIGAKLAERAPSSGLTWAESIDGDFLKLTSIAGVVGGWATQDPAGALAWVRQNYPENLDLYTTIHRSWATGDPAAAAASARNWGDAGQRAALLESIMKVWATADDPTGAAAFIGSLAPSADKDSASYAFATTISYHSPDLAWQIARGITDESAQFKALKAAFSAMVVRDPEAAAQALQATNLPARTTALLAGMLNAVAVE